MGVQLKEKSDWLVIENCEDPELNGLYYPSSGRCPFYKFGELPLGCRAYWAPTTIFPIGDDTFSILRFIENFSSDITCIFCVRKSADSDLPPASARSQWMRVKRRSRPHQNQPDVGVDYTDDDVEFDITFDDIVNSKNSKPSEMKIFYIDSPWISNEWTVPQSRAQPRAPQPPVSQPRTAAQGPQPPAAQSAATGEAAQPPFDDSEVQEEDSQPGCLERCLSNCFKKAK